MVAGVDVDAGDRKTKRVVLMMVLLAMFLLLFAIADAVSVAIPKSN